MVERLPVTDGAGAPHLRARALRLGRRLDSRVGLALVALAILALSWPVRTRQPLSFDLSWRLGLHQAVEQGLRFGHDIVFTYGPLGFLSQSVPFVGPTSALAFVVSALVYLAAIGILLGSARRLFSLPVAIVVTLLFGRGLAMLAVSETLQFVVFAAGVDLLRRDHVPRPEWVALAAGALAGAAVLGKLNIGVFVSAMAFVVVLAISPRRLRGLLALGGGFALSALVLWLATGQQVADLVPYVTASMEIISGYSDAMAVTSASVRWEYGAFVLVAAVLAWTAWKTSMGWPRGRRLALAAILLLLLFSTWKLAFTRDTGPQAFTTLAFAALVLLPATLPRSTIVTVLVAVSLAFLGVSRIPPSSYAAVVTSAREFAFQARDAFLPWRWEAATNRTRADLQHKFAVPAGIVEELRGHTVHIAPFAAGVATAYPVFTWRPEPIFQSYSAYTSSLDGLNADLLRSPQRPERILRQVEGQFARGDRTIVPAVAGRFSWFESPSATLETACRYREIATSGAWQVLADTGSACGQPTPLGTVTAAFRETVTVPPAPSPDDIVLVRVHGVGKGLLAKLRAAAWKTPDWTVTLDGYPYRLVPGTAEDGLLLAVPASAQGSPPFSFGPPVKTIAIDGPRSGGDGQLTYEFVAVPMAAR